MRARARRRNRFPPLCYNEKVQRPRGRAASEGERRKRYEYNYPRRGELRNGDGRASRVARQRSAHVDDRREPGEGYYGDAAQQFLLPRDGAAAQRELHDGPRRRAEFFRQVHYGDSDAVCARGLREGRSPRRTRGTYSQSRKRHRNFDGRPASQGLRGVLPVPQIFGALGAEPRGGGPRGPSDDCGARLDGRGRGQGLAGDRQRQQLPRLHGDGRNRPRGRRRDEEHLRCRGGHR